MQLHLIL